MEENVIHGGFGEMVQDFVREEGLELSVVSVAIPDEFVPHGNVELLKHEIGIDEDSIVELIGEWL